MPQEITNPEILELLKANDAEMQSLSEENSLLEKKRFDLDKSPEIVGLNEAQQAINIRATALSKNIVKSQQLLDQIYGWGNWHNVNVKDKTFISREELESDPEFFKKHYVMANPAIRERVNVDDAELKISDCANSDVPNISEILDKEKQDEENTSGVCQGTEENTERGLQQGSVGSDSSECDTQSQSSSQES